MPQSPRRYTLLAPMIPLALLLLAALVFVLIKSPRVPSLAEEERILRDYFRQIDKNSEE